MIFIITTTAVISVPTTRNGIMYELIDVGVDATLGIILWWSNRHTESFVPSWIVANIGK